MDVKAIPNKLTYPFLLNIHYAKRIPSISYSFGLFDNDELIGVVCYGTPPSAPLKQGIAGKEYSQYVLELNRLCLKYNRHNEASFLVSKSLKLLPVPKIIVSFADTAQQHIGTVYQACNFIYTGLSAKRTNWKLKGKEHLHGQTIADEFRGLPNRSSLMRAKYGNCFYLEPRSRKHRYIYILGSHKWKKQVKQYLKYKQYPYPKSLNEVAYEATNTKHSI